MNAPRKVRFARWLAVTTVLAFVLVAGCSTGRNYSDRPAEGGAPGLGGKAGAGSGGGSARGGTGGLGAAGASQPGGAGGGDAGAGGDAGSGQSPDRCDATTACKLDSYECRSSDLYHCELGDDGCPAWTHLEKCTGDLGICNAKSGACECDVSTPSTCTDGSTVRRCLSGAWVTDTCPGSTPTCNPNAGVCECEASEPATCADGHTVSSCDNGLWVDTPCPSETPICNGATVTCECDPSEPPTCTADKTGLRTCENGVWKTTTCGTDTPVCNTSTNECECAAGSAAQCSGSTLRICSDGKWAETACSGTTPVCNQSAARCDCNTTSLPDTCTDATTLRRCVSGQSQSSTCSSIDPKLPTCNTNTNECECTSSQASSCSGSTWTHCSNGSWATTTCSGSTPICDATAGCVPCTEHSQCPSGACHLSEYSAFYGTCFSTGQVQNITSASGLQSAIAGVTSSTVAVFKLAANTSYPVSAKDGTQGQPIPAGAEIAIIGGNGAAITGATTGVLSSSVSLWTISGIVYLGNVDVKSPGTNMTAFAIEGVFQQSPPATLWLDDLAMTQFYTALDAKYADVHIRRSVIRSSSDYSLKVESGAAYVETSVLGPNSSPPSLPALYTTTAPFIDIRYSDLWGYDTALYCNDGVTGSTQGTIRNSILLNEDSTNSSIDPKCTALTFTGDAGTGLGLAPTISWFTNVTNNDFHLTTTGANQLGKTASFGTGDPRVDIDGTAHPQGSNGYAGIDER